MERSFLQDVKAIIKSLVLSSPNPDEMTMEKLAKDYRSEEGQNVPFQQLGYQTLETFLNSISDTVRICGTGHNAIVRFVPSKKIEHIHHMIVEQKKQPARGKSRGKSKNNSFRTYRHCGTDNAYISHNLSAYANQNAQHQPRPGYVSNSRDISTFNFGDILQGGGAPTKIEGGVLNGATKKQHTTRTNLINNGDKSQQELKQATPVVVPWERVNGLRRNFNAVPAEFHDNITKEGTEDEVDELANKVENGLSLKQNKFTSGLSVPACSGSPSSSGISSRQHLMKMLRETKQYNKFETALPENNDANNTSIAEEAVPLCAINNLICSLDFPEDTAVYGTKIPPFEMPTDVKRESKVIIFISEIHSPYKFWFHFHKEGHELDAIMLKIENFYDSLYGDEFCIPIGFIMPGMLCVAPFGGMWYRAEVLTEVINGKTKVFYVDYGTVREINANSIKYLCMKFARLPAQAMRGCLSHIRPRDLHWTPEATKCFLSMVAEIPVYAQVSEINEQSGVYYLVVCNTVNVYDVQINKTLVVRGFASYDEEWQIERIQRTGRRLCHPREAFPTFLMLESGIYPTLSELVQLQNFGIDYEGIIDCHIFHPGTLNEFDNAPEILRNLPFKLLTTNPFRVDIVLHLNHLI